MSSVNFSPDVQQSSSPVVDADGVEVHGGQDEPKIQIDYNWSTAPKQRLGAPARETSRMPRPRLRVDNRPAVEKENCV